MDWKLFNVVVLGLSFMMIFTGFQTCSMVQTTVINGEIKEHNFTGSGYTSLSIIYAVFAGSNWAAPSIVSICGPKLSMILGGITYCLFIASFLKPMTWALYTGSCLIGVGAAVIWTAQGNFLTINSDEQTMGRNSGFFWAMLQSSMLWGNLYMYFTLQGDVEIEDASRLQLFIALTTASVVGVLGLVILRSNTRTTNDGSIQVVEETTGPLQALVQSFRLFFTKEMLLLCFTFAYTGFELTFFSGVYGTSVGNTKHFGQEAKSYIGLCGIFIGVGEILGGAMFGLFGTKTSKFGRDPIVTLGFIAHILSYYIVFLNLPQESPLRESYGGTYIEPNIYLAVFCAFLLGFGDSSFNTQIYSILGSVYKDSSAPAFALYKFVQSLAAAAGFFYSTALLLQWQLLILVISAVLGTLSFFLVEWKTRSPASSSGYSLINSEA